MATTPSYALPYPVGTDRVMDGDNAIQALAAKLEAVLGTWQQWEPNAAAGPIMLTAGKTCRWIQVGKLVRAHISGIYYPGNGAGLYSFVLPTPPAAMVSNLPQAIGSAFAYDWSTSYRYAGTVIYDPNAGPVATIWGGSTNGWGDTGGASFPMVWESQADRISVEFSYQAATPVSLERDGGERGETQPADDQPPPTTDPPGTDPPDFPAE